MNIISFIITQKPFNFKFTQKKFHIISKDFKEDKKLDFNLKSESNEYPKYNQSLNLNLSKTISAPLNAEFGYSELQRYNKVGKLVKEYMKDKKEKGIKCTSEINNALALLGLINNENFEKDILNFYIEKCMNISKGKEKAMVLIFGC
mgnify:CR=1 FL=1